MGKLVARSEGRRIPLFGSDMQGLELESLRHDMFLKIISVFSHNKFPDNRDWRCMRISKGVQML